MLVRDLMSAPVETIDCQATCANAIALFKRRHLRRSPVVRDGRVIGMLTDRDLARILPTSVADLERGSDHPTFKRHVESIIKREFFSIHPNDHVEQAAQIMLRTKVNALPVIENDRAIGILTESDIFRLFVRRSMTQRGHRLVLRAPAFALNEFNPATIAVGSGARVFDLSIFPLEKNRFTVAIKVKTSAINDLIAEFLSHGYELALVEES